MEIKLSGIFHDFCSDCRSIQLKKVGETVCGEIYYSCENFHLCGHLWEMLSTIHEKQEQ